VDAAEDATPKMTTVDTPADSWLQHRKRLAELIHAVRITAPLLRHRVREDGSPGAIELGEGCKLVVAGISGALIVRFTAPSWCSTAESQRLAIIAAVSVAPRPGWTTLEVSGRRTDLVISFEDPETV
jgi:hypothetical protein